MVEKPIAPGYKLTEVGEIPEDWDLKKIRECADVKYGKSNPKTKGMIPLIGSSGVFGSVSEPLIYTPTIVIGRKGTAGAVWDIRTPSWPSDTSFYLEYKTEVSQKFLFEFMSLNKLTGENAKTTLPSVKREEIEEYVFPFPPLSKQEKIAEILTDADSLIESLDSLISKKKNIKQGLMQSLLTRGLGHMKFKMTEIGEIPEDSDLTFISGLVSDLIGGGTPSTTEAIFWNGDIPWTRGASLNNHYLERGELFITKEGLKHSSTNLIPAGNILMATRVSVGNVSVNKIELAISQDVTALILKKELIFNDYLYWYLKRLTNQIQQRSQGSTIKGILKADLSKVLIPLPSLSEQQKIAEILSDADKEIEALEQKRDKYKLLKTGMMQQLLTGRIRVK